jgi:hypothetical protein
MTTEPEQTPFERAETLPQSDLSDLASIAALAQEYARKVEAGTATDTDITTLVCHCTVLTDDIFALAEVGTWDFTTDPANPEPLVYPRCAECRTPCRYEQVLSFSRGFTWAWMRNCKHDKRRPQPGFEMYDSRKEEAS